MQVAGSLNPNAVQDLLHRVAIVEEKMQSVQNVLATSMHHWINDVASEQQEPLL